MSLILPANSLTGGYEIDNSLRFNPSSNDNLGRNTWGTATSDKIFTMSVWVKRSGLGYQQIVNSYDGSTGNDNQLKFQSTDAVELTVSTSGAEYFLKTNRLFRDISAWFHIVFAFDSTQATASDRYKLYVNGTQETSFSSVSYPPQNTTYQFFRNSNGNYIGTQWNGSGGNYNGYMSEFYFIDGQALAPTDFGEFDQDTGIWKPIKYTGTYGTNGFYLDFENSGSLGADQSGNGNNFTVNNLTSIDQVTDTPTNNFATLNPLYRYTNNMTYSEGNLKVVGGGNSWQGANSTFYINKGKWFFEVKFASATDVGNFYIGWTTAGDYNISEPYDNGIHYYNSDGGEIYANSIALTTADYGTFANGDIMGMALDYDNSLLTVYKNGSALVTDYDFSSATTTAKGGNLVTPTVAHYGFGTLEWNFSSPSYAISSGNTDGNGYGNFEYAVPSGYYSLCTKNLAKYG